MIHAHGDFESKSAVDLKVVGLDNYSRHPTTDIWCLAWAIGDEEPEVWTPGEPFPPRLRKHIEDGGLFFAHNAPFELALWNNVGVPRYGFPVLHVEQCRCTMAMAYSMALPGSLEKAAAAVGITEQKDMSGHRLMMQMAKPRSEDPLTWWDDLEKIEELCDYAKQDLRVERSMAKRLMPLSQDEQALWVLDQRINNRGVGIDLPAVDAALKIVEAEKVRLDKEIQNVTGNFVSCCSEVKRLGDWIREQGVQMEGLAKANVLDALSLDDLPVLVRRALLLRQEAGKTSTAKLKAMREAASAQDGRVRGTMQYHGAGTGRWAGRRIQPQNFPRPTLKFKHVEDAIAHFDDVDYLTMFHGQPLTVVSSCLKSMIRAAVGKDLLAADFKNIEGRALAWLAGEDWKIKAFRDYDAGIGPDLYLVSAARIYGTEPTDYNEDSIERQHGKVAELACGYQGGVGAFQTMAKTYLVKVSDTVADTIKTKWREAHPKIVQYWYALEQAALDAVLNAGKTYRVGPNGRGVFFRVSGSFLWCKLPSGRVLCYPYPTVKAIEAPWGEMKDQVHYMTVDGLTNKWVETHTYGGKLAENVTQAICRDLLVAAIRQAEAKGYPVVLHVHDEVVSEVPNDFGSLEDFETACSTMPAWADGLPVVAKGWRGERYRK